MKDVFFRTIRSFETLETGANSSNTNTELVRNYPADCVNRETDEIEADTYVHTACSFTCCKNPRGLFTLLKNARAGEPRVD